MTERIPPKGREGKCNGTYEQHLHEAAVMLAVATWLFELGAEKVCIHPDGMHIKQFDVCDWLEGERFTKTASRGRTRVGGRYVRDGQSLEIEFTPGRGDVVAEVSGCRIVVEAKGGIINTNHPGQKSKLRKHLYEAVGMLLDDQSGACRLIAAVPRHTETQKIAQRIVNRCHEAGIEIALVSGEGEVEFIAGRAGD